MCHPTLNRLEEISRPTQAGPDNFEKTTTVSRVWSASLKRVNDRVDHSVLDCFSSENRAVVGATKITIPGIWASR